MMKEDRLMSKKKPMFPINDDLRAYLEKYNRSFRIAISYHDLLRFAGAITLYDENDEDTLWVRVYFNEIERKEIDEQLKNVYMVLHSDGNKDIRDFLSVDAIDYCTFGNSKPFRVKIRNVLNDNFTYFYVKQADASRVYGLDLEHILSPNRINFLVEGDTLIEEHIVGIPGDIFIKKYLPSLSPSEHAQIAKEFVKFNERCQMRLLGDMRSYNYVVIPTHDFDSVKYRIRAIDFDQQCYEGKLKVYQPQFFKENNQMVSLCSNRLDLSSILQYRKEERSVLAKRLMGTKHRAKALLEIMIKDHISHQEHIDNLKKELFDFTYHAKFRHCNSMGEILQVAFRYITKTYINHKKEYGY